MRLNQRTPVKKNYLTFAPIFKYVTNVVRYIKKGTALRSDSESTRVFTQKIKKILLDSLHKIFLILGTQRKYQMAESLSFSTFKRKYQSSDCSNYRVFFFLSDITSNTLAHVLFAIKCILSNTPKFIMFLTSQHSEINTNFG